MSEAPIELLKAMAHPARFAILQSLALGELNVGEIERASGVDQPALSQQLAVLRDSGMVESRREAKLVFYRLHGETLERLRDELTPILTALDRATDQGRHLAPDAVAVFARLT